MRELKYQLRYALRLWLVGLATEWLPENRLTQAIRGRMISAIVGSGDRLRVAKGVKLLAVHRLTLGADVYLGPGAWINCLGGLTIEDEVMLGPYVCIATTSHGFKDGSVFRGGTHKAPIRIGWGSWVGAHSTVVAGATIGSGCAIGANAVVTRDIPENTVASGVPASVIRSRTDNPSDVRTRSDA